MRGQSFLDSSLRLDGIVDILQTIKNQPIYFSQITMASKIRFKKSIQKYLRYCVDKELSDTFWKPYREGIHESKRHPKRTEFYHYYKITDKGIQFLELVK